jgi:hypothetical protein
MRNMPTTRARSEHTDDASEERAPWLVVADEEVDAAQPADRAEDLLGGGDVGDEDAVERPDARGVGRLEEPHQRQPVAVSRNAHDQAVPHREPEIVRGGAGREDRAGTRDERRHRGEAVAERQLPALPTSRARRILPVLRRGPRPVGPLEVGPERRLGEGIHAEHGEGASGMVGGGDVAGDHRRDGACAHIEAQRAVELVGEP